MLLQGLKRRVVYVVLYESIALLFGTAGFFSASDSGIERAGALAMFATVFAVAWNVGYNTLFERWEARRSDPARRLGRRVAHALGFELGFLVVLMPVAAWWLDISYARSFVVNIGLNLFFLGYTFAFTWAFDRVFGLPVAALR